MEMITNVGFFHDPLDIILRRKQLGKPIAIDKATQIKSRPSTARVKVILDLMEKLPNRIWLQFVDRKSGMLIEIFQEIVYDNLPLYCNYCKHQGHDEDSYRLLSKRNQNNKQIDDNIEVILKGTIDSEKYQGDAREILNKKRKIVDVDQSEATSLNQQLIAATSEQNRANLMDVDTNIENKGDCNNQHAATNEVQSKEVGLNLMGTPRVGVDTPRVGLGQKLMDSRQKLMDTSDVEDAEKSGQHVLQGVTGNFHDSEKIKDISNALRDLLCSNSFDVLLKTIGNQDCFDKDEEDNMLDICFDRVARKGIYHLGNKEVEATKAKRTHMEDNIVGTIK
ncbi:hypothetical protein H5410_015905 [Solanum commersonii]|uniref:DUF4283 domain-containing protein n=1 Tax=Solanum commersonii TaxID=4109 RepID=A0A9J5ZV00_SOLCO|nr:hypothetical protein H5410_015905 [Solanum commersonii]